MKATRWVIEERLAMAGGPAGWYRFGRTSYALEGEAETQARECTRIASGLAQYRARKARKGELEAVA